MSQNSFKVPEFKAVSNFNSSVFHVGGVYCCEYTIGGFYGKTSFYTVICTAQSDNKYNFLIIDTLPGDSFGGQWINEVPARTTEEGEQICCVYSGFDEGLKIRSTDLKGYFK